MTAAERMRRMRERRKADGLRPVVSWVQHTAPARPGYSSHRLLEARSLAMHAVVAQKIERDPKLLDIPRNNLKRWRARWEKEAPAWYDQWVRNHGASVARNRRRHYRAQRRECATQAILSLCWRSFRRSIGEGSPFHELYGYYAQGVGERAAALPKGWRDRLVRIENPNTRGVAGLCLEVHDLAASKHIAGREKDLQFTRELARHGMTDARTLVRRLKETKVPMELRKLIEARIRRDSTQTKK